jgi:addiction module RelB/DinJ family antitoxin
MKTLISIKVDKDIKIKAQNLSQNLGIPLSTLVNAYLRQFVREKRAVFTTAWQMSPELEQMLGPIESDIKAGRNLGKFISAPEELNEVL